LAHSIIFSKVVFPRKFGGGTTVVTCDFHASNTFYCVCMITSRCTRRAAAEEDAVGEQQQKQTQLGCSLVWPSETSAL